jgi:hypothetical protein
LSWEMGQEYPIRPRGAARREKQGGPWGAGKWGRTWAEKGKWEEEGWAGYRKSAQRHYRAIKYFPISKPFINCKLFQILIKFLIRTILIVNINLIAHNQYRRKLCNGMRCNKQLYTSLN